MTAFEDEVGRRLADLAGELTTGAPPSAEAARRQHARMRRTRLGVVGTGLAVLLVVIGVPLGLARSGPDDVAVEPPVSTTQGTTSATTTSAPTTTPSRLPAPATPTDAAWQARLAQAAELAAQLTGSVSPRAPVPFATCPELAADLSSALGVRITPDGGESGPVGAGAVEPDSGVCSWATPATVAETGPVSTRFGMTVKHMPDVRVDDVRGRYFVCDQGGPCPTVDAPVAGPDAFLVSGLGGSFESLDLVVPDAGGNGIWVVDAYRGTDYTGPSLLQGLDATATALATAYGTP